MRTVSANFRQAMFDENTTEIPVLLLTISHPDLENGDLFLSTDNADLLDFETQRRGTVSRGLNFEFLPMQLSLPEDAEDASPMLQLSMSDIDQEASTILRSTVTPAYVTIEVVLASDPDFVEMEFVSFELSSADVTAESVSLNLTVDTLASEPYPADTFTPGRFGGLWTEY
ncbi:DUF1833 domain-containing protein [Jiella endophytica]|uniref:DUF1833 domain-containing protein n=1 Tax=Jiella endophytica TaxID=2558362 RepID=A0A4Y8RE18_9HYPH|nr:DUF1833 family protein [Jiella endophytica]TFF20546.1 DUF1833 domain-containing protein [Jiella endophytica]